MLTASFPNQQLSVTVAPGSVLQVQVQQTSDVPFAFDAGTALTVAFLDSSGQPYASTTCSEPVGTDTVTPATTRTLQFVVPTNLYPDTYSLRLFVTISGSVTNCTLPGMGVSTGYAPPNSAPPPPTSPYDASQDTQEASELIGGGGSSVAPFATAVLTRSAVAKNRVSRLIQFEGTNFLLDSGEVLRGMLQQNDRAISRMASDGGEEVGRPEVVFFAGEAFGKIREGTLFSANDEDTSVSINYKVDGPLHPEFYRNKCVYLAVPVTKY